MENKKIKNAKTVLYDNIRFKSKLEAKVYISLKEAGYNADYESRTWTIMEGFQPTKPFYNAVLKKDKSTGKSYRERLSKEESKIRSITYTPDFTMVYNDWLIVIEVKGKENDAFPRTKKLFRHLMESSKERMAYFVIYSLRDLKDMLEILKTEFE